MPKQIEKQDAVSHQMRPVAITFFSAIFAVMALLTATATWGAGPAPAATEITER